MTLPFHKMVGTGNDFIFIHKKDLPNTVSLPLLIPKICDRHFGVGADGFVVISPPEQQSTMYSWDFYNSDGSSAEMCGNAARCAILFILEQFQVSSCEFNTLAGPVSGQKDNKNISAQWTLQSTSLELKNLKISNQKVVEGYFINTGVPHFVIDDTQSTFSRSELLEIQKHPTFGAANTNVTTLSFSDDSFYKTRTFERGVENFTLACGTGVIASAFVLKNKTNKNQHQLQAPGGQLYVRIHSDSVELIAPAQFVFVGQYKVSEDCYV